MKHVPNLITCFRILSSIALLFSKPLSMQFFLIYSFCGASDILDGYIARKTGNTSKAGAILDSVADMALTAATLFVLIPIITFSAWIVYWIIGIVFIRISSLVFGYIKFRTLASLHTYANKATGLMLFCFPFVFQICSINKIAFVLLVIASFTAVEELAINIKSSSLNRDTKSIFAK